MCDPEPEVLFESPSHELEMAIVRRVSNCEPMLRVMMHGEAEYLSLPEAERLLRQLDNALTQTPQ